MARTYEEKINYEVNKLKDDPSAMDKFFHKAIGIQNSPKTYTKSVATKKFLFACDVLCGHLGYKKCPEDCLGCELNTEHGNCMEQIDLGLRKRPEKQNIIKFDHKSYILKVYKNKRGVITQVLTPINRRPFKHDDRSEKEE